MFFETFARSRQRYEDLIQIIACLSVRVFHVGYTPVRHTNGNTYIGHDFVAKAKKEKAAILDEAADRAKTWEKGHCLLTSGMVSVETPTVGAGFRGTFLCHCADCRTITAAAFANNFTVAISHIEHVRGESTLKQYGQSTTIASGNSMTNSFCSNCGTLMYRVSSGTPHLAFMRVGTVDDFALHDTKLKPQIEIWTKDRLAWLDPIDGCKQSQAQPAKL
ncbi:hypothetical protein NDA16_002766 [Ustilago loliicola]|nr:hypothetical protein NDA16_002766 [Ustilago loliicola]